MRNVLHLEREKCAPTGSPGNLLQHAIAAQYQAAVVGGNGVDNHLSTLRHLNCLCPGNFALVVFSIAHDNDGLANGMIRPVFQKFFFASLVNGVVEGGATTGMQLVHGPVEPRVVIGKILRQLAVAVEPDDESFVESRADTPL